MIGPGIVFSISTSMAAVDTAKDTPHKRIYYTANFNRRKSRNAMEAPLVLNLDLLTNPPYSLSYVIK